MGWSVCPSVRQDISGTTHAIFTKYLCMLPVSVARSSSGMLTIGRIAYPNAYIAGTTRAIFTKFFFTHVAYVRGSVLIQHVYRIAYRWEGVFFPTENASARKGGWEQTAWAKYAIYDYLVTNCTRFTMGAPFPQNCPFPWTDLHPLIYDSLGQSEPTTQTASPSVQSFLHR